MSTVLANPTLTTPSTSTLTPSSTTNTTQPLVTSTTSGTSTTTLLGGSTLLAQSASVALGFTKLSSALDAFGGRFNPAEYPKLYQLAENLRKGDLLFIEGENLVTQISDRKWTHVAICVDPGDLAKGILPTFVEAEGNAATTLSGTLMPGVVETRLDSVLSRYKAAGRPIEYHVVRPSEDPATIDKAVAFARSKLGSSYDYTFNQLENTSNDKYYCSELVVDAYRAAGLELRTAPSLLPTAEMKVNALVATLKVLGTPAATADAFIKACSFSAKNLDPEEQKKLVEKFLTIPGISIFCQAGAYAKQLATDLANACIAVGQTGDIETLQKALAQFSEANLGANLSKFDLQKLGGMAYPSKPPYAPPGYNPPAYQPPAYNPPTIGTLTGSYPTFETIWHWEWWGGWPEVRTHWHSFTYPNPLDVANRAAYDTWYTASKAAYDVDFGVRTAYYTTIEYPLQQATYHARYQAEISAYALAYGTALAVNTTQLLSVAFFLTSAATVVAEAFFSPGKAYSQQTLISPGSLAEAYPAAISCKLDA